VVGHIAAYPRRFRCGKSELQIAVLGNLVIDPQYRNSMVGPRLLSFPASLVKRGRLEAVIAFANESAHAGFLRAGFHDFGRMQSFVDIRHTGPLLMRRLPRPRLITAGVALVLDAGLATRRAMHRSSARAKEQFRIAEITAAQFATLDNAHWSTPASDAIVTADRFEYVAKRYLRCPYYHRRMFGVFGRDHQLEAYVIVEGEARLKVWDCQVNRARLSRACALQLVSEALPGIEMMLVPTFADTELAAELRRGGFIERPPFEYIERTTQIAMCWAENHPLAERFADRTAWELWFGSNHY
jgi:hypothetical protein